MAVCQACGREMMLSGSCISYTVRFADDPTVYSPVKYGEEEADWGAADGHPCHDCMCPPGGYHHANCDVERCPRCGGQAFGYDCKTV